MAYSNSPSISNVPDLTNSPYYDTSLSSPSPSPRMVYNAFPSQHNNNSSAMYTTPNSPYLNNQILDPQYLARRAHQQQQQAAILASVEFTDLTNPVYEDRRRRRSSTTQDKQAISNMGIRRRAQNRASQRAFRERKEKHVQHLETELQQLEARFRELQTSHTSLGATNEALTKEVEQLRGEIKTMRVLSVPNDFDRFAAGEADGVFETEGDFTF
ncbi:MAG: hypothetical protein L6R40_006926 [Gallowayella cf. fulva]|nr:MAG: hypothetical protein L6R40_006926 [Xanthomendoza cf. fulva]